MSDLTLTITQVLLGSTLIALIVSALAGGVLFLLTNWIKSRVEQSIKHENDKKLFDYEQTQLQHQKAEMAAHLIARWIKYGARERELLDQKELIDHYEELNRMSLQMSLWIRDEVLLDDLMKSLRNEEGSYDIRALSGRVRKLILGLESDAFNPQNITLWPKDGNSDEVFTLHEKSKP